MQPYLHLYNHFLAQTHSAKPDRPQRRVRAPRKDRLAVELLLSGARVEALRVLLGILIISVRPIHYILTHILHTTMVLTDPISLLNQLLVH